MENAVIGSAQLYYTTLTSTNLFAQLLLSKTRPRAGTVISTGFQSAGHGQFGRSWFGSKGTNLYASVILYPQILATAQFTLSAFVALAIRDTVQHFIDKEVKIKWPNDIYVENRKIAGILIQNSLSAQTIQNSIIGVGLNVNETSFPEEVQNPTSLAIETGQKFEIAQVMHKLLECMNEWHERAQNLPLNLLTKQYMTHMYKLGESCRFLRVETKEQLLGIIRGVDETGRILLALDDDVIPQVGIDIINSADDNISLAHENPSEVDNEIDIDLNTENSIEVDFAIEDNSSADIAPVQAFSLHQITHSPPSNKN